MPSTVAKSAALAEDTPRIPPKRRSKLARFLGPTPAMSSSLLLTRTLSRLARSYARLAQPESDALYGESLTQLGRAMSMHPELVSGTGRNDADFMRAGRGDWVSKVGADGVQVVGSRSRGQALAIKIMDGNKTALFAATVEALDQLGWLDDAQRRELAPWRAQVLLNVAGAPVGERRSVFKLRHP